MGSTFGWRAGGVSAALVLALAGTALGQYAINEDTLGAPPTQRAKSENEGPVRLARFSLVDGNVTWRANDSLEWAEANINLPLQQDAQIWVERGGHAEIQFDDGSVLRLAGGSVAVIQTLTSDQKGAYTAIKLSRGLGYLRLRSEVSEYEIITPQASVRAVGPAKVRVGTSDQTEIGVREGEARVEGDGGTATVQEDQYLSVGSGNGSYEARALPRGDRWDQYNDDLDQGADRRSVNLPSNIALVAGDLERDGDWRQDAEYGQVWSPRGVAADWQPYRDGRWVWVRSMGWTWCSRERWGWAPYHYGSWVRRNYGWAWCPGPERQYWSPAVVHFTEFEGNISWCPLSPRDVRYPTNFSVGFFGGNWALSFSIGRVGWYRPVGGYCEAGPWGNDGFGGWNRYVPYNARNGWGVCRATREQFTVGWQYETTRVRAGYAFEFGQGRPGGWGVRPSANSWTGSRGANRPGPSGDWLNRPGWKRSGTRVDRSNLRPDVRKDRPVGWPERPGGSSGSRPDRGNDRPVGSPERPGWGANPSGTRPERGNDRPVGRPESPAERPGWGANPSGTRPERGNDRPVGRPESPVERPGWGGSSSGTRPERGNDRPVGRPESPVERPGWGGSSSGTRPERPARDSGWGRRDTTATPRTDRNPAGGWGSSRAPRTGRESTSGRAPRQTKRGGGW